MLQKAIYLSSPDLGQVTNFKPKMRGFKRLLDLIWSKQKDFFNWLSNLKNFVFLNGSEIRRNMIQMALK